jgi:hypothetical protein
MTGEKRTNPITLHMSFLITKFCLFYTYHHTYLYSEFFACSLETWSYSFEKKTFFILFANLDFPTQAGAYEPKIIFEFLGF